MSRDHTQLEPGGAEKWFRFEMHVLLFGGTMKN
jgi:hypothetical protein